MRLKLLIVIIIIELPVTLFAKSGSSEAGLFYSTWGTGIQGSYNFTDEILFGGDFASQNTASSSGSSGSTIESETTIQTVNGFARYYLRDLGVTDGIFGQAGIAFRNWNGTGSITEDRTNAKLASIKMTWSPLVFVSGLGWHKVWGFGMSFSISYNASLGGSRTVEYTENMLRFSDSLKKDLEEKTDFPSNLIIYVGYSF